MQPSLDLVLAALANPTRRAILDRLRGGAMPVGDLAAPFALSQPTISAHLKVMEAAGLIARGRQGNSRPVRLQPLALAALDDWIGPYRQLWEDRMDRLESLALDLQQQENAMTTTATDPLDARTATLSRVMEVPAKYLFLAHSRPEHLMRWFGPEGYPVTHCEVDFRVGGKWRMIMTGPDGKEGPPFGGTYHEIVPYSRIVCDDAFEDLASSGMPLKHAGPMLMTTTFDEADGRTTVTVTILFTSAEMKAEYLGIGMLEGFTSTLGQLEGVAKDLARQG